MSIEIHVHTRGKLRPDPSLDPVLAIFYCVHNDWPLPDNSVNTQCGVLAIDLINYPLKTIPKASPLRNRSPPNQNWSPAKGSPVKGTPIKGSLTKMSPAKVKSPIADVAPSLTSNRASNGTDRKSFCPHPPPQPSLLHLFGDGWEGGGTVMTCSCVGNSWVQEWSVSGSLWGITGAGSDLCSLRVGLVPKADRAR